MSSTALYDLALVAALKPLRRAARRRYPDDSHSYGLDRVAREGGFPSWRALVAATKERIATFIAAPDVAAVAATGSAVNQQDCEDFRERAKRDAALAEIWNMPAGEPSMEDVKAIWAAGENSGDSLDTIFQRVRAIAPEVVARAEWRAGWSLKQHLRSFYRGIGTGGPFSRASTFYTLAGTSHYVRQDHFIDPTTREVRRAIAVECFGNLIDVAPLLTVAIVTCKFDGVLAWVHNPAVDELLERIGFAPGQQRLLRL